MIADTAMRVVHIKSDETMISSEPAPVVIPPCVLGKVVACHAYDVRCCVMVSCLYALIYLNVRNHLSFSLRDDVDRRLFPNVCHVPSS